MSDPQTTKKHYRIVTNEWNLKDPPWTEAIGIEEVEFWPDGSEVYAVPAVVCWVTRGTDPSLVDRILAGLNDD